MTKSSKKIGFLLIFLVGFIFSCKRKSNVDFDYSTIHPTYDMHGEVFIDTMMSPQAVDYYESTIISIENNGLFKLKVYDSKNGKEIQSVIRGGRGVKEMIQPWNLSIQRDTCWLFDLMTKKVIGLNNKNDDTITYTKEFVLNDRCSEMLVSNGKNSFIGIGHSDSIKLFSEYNSSGQLIHNFGNYPDIIISDFQRGEEA